MLVLTVRWWPGTSKCGWAIRYYTLVNVDGVVLGGCRHSFVISNMYSMGVGCVALVLMGVL